MTPLRKPAAIAAMIAAYAILFVVVCPATPTPTALVSSAGTLPGAQAAVVVLAIPLAAIVLVSGLAALMPLVPRMHSLSVSRVVDLTCARLC